MGKVVDNLYKVCYYIHVARIELQIKEVTINGTKRKNLYDGANISAADFESLKVFLKSEEDTLLCGGSALIYNADIAKHYCTPSELKKTHNGERKPNSREDWLDVQARALWQAALMIRKNLVTE